MTAQRIFNILLAPIIIVTCLSNIGSAAAPNKDVECIDGYLIIFSF